MKPIRLGAWIVALACLNVAWAAAPLPQMSPEGLQLQPAQDGRVVYLRPGAKFDKYQRVAILDCYVEFAKDWQRDYNSSHVDPSNRVTSADMDRIKTSLAAEFKKIFTEELQRNGGYQIAASAAPDVLVLRPALVDLRVTAPDLMTPGMSTTVVASAGTMTLYLELWDSTTNVILARVLAPASAADLGRGQISSGVANAAAADRVLRAWAVALRKRFDAVHAVSAKAS